MRVFPAIICRMNVTFHKSTHPANRCRRAFLANQQARPARARTQKKELTGELLRINLSASVDETVLIESGRGTGPTTPRQPVEARFQCPGANSSPNRKCWFGEDEKSVCPSSRHDAKGFFIAPANGGGTVFRAFQKTSGRAQRIPANRQVMEKNAGFMKALKCRECGRAYPLAATHVCE